MVLLGMAKTHRCRPSSLLDIDDPYTAYCLDEACSYIVRQIQDGNEPTFRQKFKSFTDLYRQYE